ncbi:MAG: glycosyltransferase family 39 protein [Pseudomonadota bacterium]
MSEPVTTAGPTPLRGPGPRRADLGVAGGLFVVTLCLVMGTTGDLGFNRDETFYHHHAKVYWTWLSDLVEAPDGEARGRLLSDETVERVWRNNYEHPPLMKVLFGLSWKIFGAKKRSLRVLDARTLKVTGLDRPHGFEEGDQFEVLRPLIPGEAPGSPERVVGFATVTRRDRNEAAATLLEWTPEEDSRVFCDPRRGGPDGEPTMGGCVGRTDAALQVLSEADAFRLPGAVSGALFIALLYLFSLHFVRRRGALFAALAMLFVPRAFYHMHVTCFDMPITLLGFSVVYAFWKSERGGRPWAVLTGVLWGLALLVKLNAFFLPVTLGLYWLVTVRGRIRRFRWLPFPFPAIPPAFFAMILVGPLMLYLLWPILWYHPVENFGRYLAFHMKHDHYYQSYFGRALQTPPFPVAFPFVMTLITVPLLTQALALWGGLRALVPFRIQGRDAPETWRRRGFLAINMLFPIALIAMPSTPVFGGVKHWLLTMPFFCLLAGVGFDAAADALLAWPLRGLARRRVLATAAITTLGVLFMAPAARDTLKYADNGTAYYNELIGGLRGAADRRMQRQFWSHATIGGLDHVNRHLPFGAEVDFQDATSGACRMYQLEERLRQDLRCVVRRGRPEVVLFDVEERFTEEEWQYQKRLHTLAPIAEHAVDGVPMLRVYQRDAGHDDAEALLEGTNGNQT